MKLVTRLVLAGAVVASLTAVSPASATDCSNPKEPCGGCSINRNFSTEDLRPIRCYA